MEPNKDPPDAPRDAPHDAPEQEHGLDQDQGQDQEAVLVRDRHEHEHEHAGQCDLVLSGVACQVVWNPLLRHYCGYVKLDNVDLSDTACPEPHGGWTARNGFDCAHLGDYPLDARGTFKTFDFVVHELSVCAAWFSAQS